MIMEAQNPVISFQAGCDVVRGQTETYYW